MHRIPGYIIILVIVAFAFMAGCKDKAETPQKPDKVVKTFKMDKKQSVDNKSEEKLTNTVDSGQQAGPVLSSTDKSNEALSETVNIDERTGAETSADVSDKSDKPKDAGGEQSDAIDAATPVLDDLGIPVQAFDTDDLEEDQVGYNPKGRIDPFQPIFGVTKEKAVQSIGDKPQTIRDARKNRLTDLEKLDLSQLKLTGIMNMAAANRRVAMVEEITGKGHVVKKGTYIGINSGRVVEITPDAVIIEEEVENYMGDIVARKRELKLQKPLGER